VPAALAALGEPLLLQRADPTDKQRALAAASGRRDQQPAGRLVSLQPAVKAKKLRIPTTKRNRAFFRDEVLLEERLDFALEPGGRGRPGDLDNEVDEVSANLDTLKDGGGRRRKSAAVSRFFGRRLPRARRPG
jgi:hypothetical protein